MVHGIAQLLLLLFSLFVTMTLKGIKTGFFLAEQWLY